jgi:hypothetical protein
MQGSYYVQVSKPMNYFSLIQGWAFAAYLQQRKGLFLALLIAELLSVYSDTLECVLNFKPVASLVISRSPTGVFLSAGFSLLWGNYSQSFFLAYSNGRFLKYDLVFVTLSNRDKPIGFWLYPWHSHH